MLAGGQGGGARDVGVDEVANESKSHEHFLSSLGDCSQENLQKPFNTTLSNAISQVIDALHLESILPNGRRVVRPAGQHTAGRSKLVECAGRSGKFRIGPGRESDGLGEARVDGGTAWDSHADLVLGLR